MDFNLEQFFIDIQNHNPPLTIEEIQLLLETKHNITLDIDTIEKWLTATKSKAEIKKSLDSKITQRSITSLLKDLNTLRDMLVSYLSKMDKTTNLSIDTIRELRRLILDIKELNKEIEEKEREELSLYYVPISDLREWIEKHKGDIDSKIYK